MNGKVIITGEIKGSKGNFRNTDVKKNTQSNFIDKIIKRVKRKMKLKK
jgi:hypothetical protein